MTELGSFSCTMPATHGKHTVHTRRHALLRHPSLNSSSLYPVPPLHRTAGRTRLPHICQDHRLPSVSRCCRAKPGERGKSGRYVQASSLPAWCVSQELRQVCVPVAAGEDPHTQFGSSPSSHTSETPGCISHNPAEVAKPADFSFW